MKMTVWVGVGVIAVAGVVVYLARHPLRIESKWMLITTNDADGDPVGEGQWVSDLDSEVVAHDGMSRVVPWVTRLMASRALFDFLIILTPDGQLGFGVSYEHGHANLAFNVRWRSEPRKEHDIRSLFAGLGIAPTQDCLAVNGGATRVLAYPVPGDATEVAALCCRVLREVYGVTDTEGLGFTYQEDP